MYIIDETYFTKELVIPNQSAIDVGGSTAPFSTWIDQQSRLFLQSVLGNVLFTDFDANVTDGVLDVGAPQKWIDLVDGKTYTENGVSYTWKGLKFEEGAFKGSIIAYFVYCKWLEYQLSRQSGIGEVRGSAANSASVGTTHRYVTTWNTFVDMYQGTHDTDMTITVYRGVPFLDYYGDREDGYVSLVQFLLDNEEDYPKPAVRRYNYLNTFGV